MPRPKKLPGQAVDKRNGERASLPAVPLARFTLPRRSDGLDYDLRTRRMWKALFDDAALSSVLSPVDRELVIRWAQAVDDHLKALASARERPISKGSTGQEVPSPHFAIAAQAMSVVTECERQIGIGALNRARLNIAVGESVLTLDDVNKRLNRPPDQPKRPDPRVIPGTIEQ